MNWRRNFLSLSFVLPSFYLFTILILFFLKKTNIFFSVDPESQFYSNALRLLTGLPTHFIDHPGTFFQMALAFILLPFRVYYLIWHQSSFVVWWLENAEYVWGIYRVFNVFLYLIGFFLILKSTRILFKSILAEVGVFLFIINQSFFSNQNIWVLAFGTESMIFFLSGLWLFLASKLQAKESDKKLFWLLPIISGFGLANRAHFLAIPLSTIFILLVNGKKHVLQKIKNLFAVCSVILLSFIIGTFPGIPHYRRFFDYMVSLISHSQIHGGGEQVFFSSKVYLASISTLFSKDPQYFLMVLIILFLLSLGLKYRSRTRVFIRKLYLPLTLGTLISLVILAKYPESHYMFINYSLISFLFSYTFLFVPKIISKPLFVILVILLFIISMKQIITIDSYFDMANRTRDFINQYKDDNKSTIWTYSSPTKEYGLIMGLIFSGQYYRELKQLYPNYVNMDDSPKKIYEFDSKTHDIRKFCWEKAFIPSFMVDELLKQYAHPNELEILPSPDKNVYYLKRITCSDKSV